MKKKLTLLLPAALILVFSALLFFGKAQTYSASERRLLSQFPKAELQTLDDGSFMQDFEAATLDQFPLRDKFRSFKSAVSLYLLHRGDHHGLYVQNGYISKLEYPINQERIDRAVAVLQKVQEMYLNDSDCRVYLSIIPDKNYYLAALGNYPMMDYAAFAEYVRENLPHDSYVDIYPYLRLEDYYRTDQHWRQENIVPVAERLATAMDVPFDGQYQQHQTDVPFYGAYVGQLALPVKADTITYLTNDAMAHCVVTSYNSGKPQEAALYDMAKLQGRDPYEMFLCGSDALVTVENPDCHNGRELVIFRDSFASSLAPLLIDSYEKITLIDLRYIRPELVGEFVDFTNQDVLFLYSTLVLNAGLGT